ncbi:MAG: hypothetical protein COB53_12355 [Elusimicrobia bacterium]|nr:MAG: hypothetical protein COB53_12355 [Elusimicrobiota bacterium]
MALHLPINAECNIQCTFCSSAGRNGDFSLAKLKADIDADTIGHIQISGGDPLLRDSAELLEIVTHCRKKGKIIEFQTNAVLATRYDEKVFGLIAKLVDFFNVNFSAHNAELDEQVTLVPGGYDWRIKGIHYMTKLGARVRLTYIVHNTNVHQAPDFVDFVAREFPDVEWIQFSYVKGMGRAKGSLNVIPRFEDAAGPLNAAMKKCMDYGIKFDVDHIPVCFVRDYKDHHADYQKMQDEQTGVHLTEKQKTGECEGCDLASWCPGPRRDYVELHGALHS